MRECAEAVLAIEGRAATQILGSQDDPTLRSCATLFGLFRLLAKYYDGAKDERTLRLLENDN